MNSIILIIFGRMSHDIFKIIVITHWKDYVKEYQKLYQI